MEEDNTGEGTGIESMLPEAPVSITVKGYYKGFSVLITKRKEELDKDEADNIIKAIDNLVEKGFEPSWNKETSQKQLDPDPEWMQEKYNCNECGAKAELRSGTSKAGKAWKGIFCSDNSNHVKWIRE